MELAVTKDIPDSFFDSEYTDLLREGVGGIMDSSPFNSLEYLVLWPWV
jgi:hypothetical protein